MNSPDNTAGQAPSVSLPQLCYDVAYFILPHYAANDVPKVATLCRDAPTAGRVFFYVMACQGRGVEPDPEDAKRFCWHHGTLTEGDEYFALEYPVPPPVDLLDLPPEQMFATKVVLAPHFSVIVRNIVTGAAEYFILGQSPMGGGTTLRRVTVNGREHINANLGPGPEPKLDAFLAAVRERLERRQAPRV
ncbi:MAG: hypothetical protein K2V38_06040 [Gemmataceae bacterium]|nr:hypothetical protein [Gemmataceae bacterium]